jgi:hypothetical protein
MYQSEKVTAIAKILRKRYADLSKVEAVTIALMILEEIDKEVSKVEIVKTDGA